VLTKYQRKVENKISALRKYSIRILIAVIIHFLIKIFDQTFQGKLLVFDLRGTLFLIFFVLFILLIWEIGDVIYKYSVNRLLRKYDIIRQFTYLVIILTLYGLIVMILFTISYSLFDIIIFDFHHYQGENRFFDFDANLGMFAGYMCILLFNGQIYLFNHWKKERFLSEQLQKENFKANYEILKNQIDPHFFFNNLSVLTSLIYKNQDLAAEYINQLSKIYRYILERRNEILVPLQDELSFLNSYFFLIKIRHENHIGFSVNINPQTNINCYLPPNTLQMLIENAIKHNQFSDDEPLEITITENDGFLIIKNTLKKRKLVGETSRLGLENIRKRYALLGNGNVAVEEGTGTFTVFLPKLGKDIYESTHIRR
jgi:two-component system LytT family sensor kinase